MKRYETLIYSTVGVLALLLILVLANFVLAAFNQRIDFTEGGLYTVSQGTRSIIEKLDAPVKIRFYYTQSEQNIPLPIKGFARRVEDLLAAFRSASGGKVLIEKLDPQPDSDAEDSATLEGVEAQVMQSGDKFYLGLSISYADQKLALPALSLDREQLLEYDLARAIARATRSNKPVIGVMSPMPLFGSRGVPQMGVPPADKQVLVSELERDFTVRRVDPGATAIDDAIKVLLVVNPRGMSDETEYALDQYVLRGGKMIAMLDPYAYFDVPPGAQQGGTSSTLKYMLKGWGLNMDTSKVVQDLKFLSGRGARQMSTVLSFNTEAFNKDDVATSKLGFTMFPVVGAFTGTPVAGLRQTVLIRTSTFSQLADASNAATQGEASVRGFKPSGIEYPVAIRLSGKFKTTFPGGPPAARDNPAAQAPGNTQSAAEPAKPIPAHIAEGRDENAIVLIADSDFINDGAAVNIQEIFGQRIVVPANSNLAFAQALIEQFAGDPALIDLRARAIAARPFTVIREMEAQAAQTYVGKLKELEDSLQQTQKRLTALQKSPAPGQGTIMSAEQQREVEDFRKKAAETRRELKLVRRDLRADSESLQFWTKVANIALLPLLVAIFGIWLGVHRRRKVVTI